MQTSTQPDDNQIVADNYPPVYPPYSAGHKELLSEDALTFLDSDDVLAFLGSDEKEGANVGW